MAQPKQTINKKELVIEEDWCPFHLLVTIIIVSWYNFWTAVWTRYIEEDLRKDIHNWLEKFCPEAFCNEGLCPDWCSDIQPKCDTWLYTHQLIYFNFVILVYIIIIQPVIVFFASNLMPFKIRRRHF